MTLPGSAGGKLRIAILWHMHQPDYRHPETGQEEMPWVRLHAAKSYYDMPRLVDEAPAGVKATFNLTPVLVGQILDLVEHGPRDAFHRVSRVPPNHLRPEDRRYILDNFFSVNHERHVNPVPGYARIHRIVEGSRRGGATLPSDLTDQDYLDLTVFFHLAWTGRTLREDPLVQSMLAKKGGGFSEKERRRLLEIHQSIIPRILPYYRSLWEEGRIEVSTTPLHHPILPLLCDSAAAREGNPEAPVDGLAFRFPEDAREQVLRGRAMLEEQLGRLPPGLWPSEGSLSHPVIKMLEEVGVSWVATDQQVLENSLRFSGGRSVPPHHLRPWRVRGTSGPAIFFRDTTLSDGIGFTYSRWSVSAAVEDFMGRARALLASDPTPHQACLPVILDGENAWEFYEDQGVPFLSALYRALGEDEAIKPTTFSEALDEVPIRTLPLLRAGSWIYGNLDTWIGHPEKNRAWELLTETRQELADRQDRISARARQATREHLLRAEASDWFWWLGDDHPSAYKLEFDALFRLNLQAAWRAMGRTPPGPMLRPIPEPGLPEPPRYHSPYSLILPRIDGRRVLYHEWTGAGWYDATRASGAIVTGKPVIARMDFGFDPSHLFIRLSVSTGRAVDLLGGAVVRVHVAHSSGERIVESREGAAPIPHGPMPRAPVGECAVGEVFEMSVTMDHLGLAPEETADLHVEVLIPDGPAERLPRDGAIHVRIPSADFDIQNWAL